MTGNKDSQLEMTRKLELPEKDYLELKEYAMGLGLDVFSTPMFLSKVKCFSIITAPSTAAPTAAT